MLYSWQNSDYKSLTSSFMNGNFHALLVYGAANSGQQLITNKLIQFILCTNKLNHDPCDECSSCILYKESNHPDLFVLQAPEDDDKKTPMIKMEQIQPLISAAYRSNHVSTNKIVFIPKVKELNINSANALLKILEEPPTATLFILQADDIAKVLPTIKSRCFKYALTKPAYEEALLHVNDIEHRDFWLTYFDGEPLFDVPLTNEQLQVAISGLSTPSIDNINNFVKHLDVKKIPFAISLEFIIKWLSDLVQVSLNAKPSYFTIYTNSLTKLSNRVNKDKLYSLQSDLVFLLEWSNHPLNQKLQLENILYKYQQVYV